MGYNPASQISGETLSNDGYAWTDAPGSSAYTSNGLNQYANVNGITATHDANGNLTLEPLTSASYSYNSENRLTVSTGGGLPSASLSYDPFGNLAALDTGSSARRFVYDGNEVVAEVNASGVIQWRGVRGDAADELVGEYWGNGTGSRHFDHLDERGSIIAASDSLGAVNWINRYDDYGMPAGANGGRFMYTGQMWLGELRLYNYKARMYDPRIGRFVQPDPIGYADGANLYAYVGNDPVNATDPSGLVCYAPGHEGCTFDEAGLPPSLDDIVIVGNRTPWDDALIIRGFEKTTHVLPPGLGRRGAGGVTRNPTSKDKKKPDETKSACNVAGIQWSDSAADVGATMNNAGAGIIIAGAVTADPPLMAFGAVVAATGNLIQGGAALARYGFSNNETRLSYDTGNVVAGFIKGRTAVSSAIIGSDIGVEMDSLKLVNPGRDCK